MRKLFSCAITIGLSIGLGLAMCSCQNGNAPSAGPSTKPLAAVPATAPTKAKAFAPVPDQTHLENAHIVTSKIISGAQPEDEDSFRELQKLGIKTILSVDGAPPNVEMAHKYGMKYVHIPITYGGVKPEEGKAIAKALDELPGPIYVHCHHGKHRSAAAVAVACVYNGMLPPEKAVSVLETFGTGLNYKGLWSAARDAKPMSAEELKELKVTYVERKEISPLAKSMVQLDEGWDQLKSLQKAGWKSKDAKGDPAHEALLVEELLHEMNRLDTNHGKSPEFLQMLTSAEEHAKNLAAALSAKPVDYTAADAAFKMVGNSCASCHKAYRD